MILVPFSNSPVTVDGVVGLNEWSEASLTASISNLVEGSISGPSDFSGSVLLKWDASNLYMLFSITDDARSVDSSDNDPLNVNSYQDDSVEIYFDINHTGAGALDTAAGRYQYRFSLENGEIETFPAGSHPTTNFLFSHTGSPGFLMEVSTPWTTLGVTNPTIGTTLGFEMAYNDDDDGDGRDAQLFWNAVSGTAWNDASQWGDIQLTAAIPEPKSMALLMGLSGIVSWKLLRRRQSGKKRRSISIKPD